MAIKHTQRDPEHPIPAGTVEIQGGLIAFAVAGTGRIDFGVPMTSPLTVMGLRLCPMGHIDLAVHSFDIHGVHIDRVDPIAEDSHWIDRSDWDHNYFKHTENALKRLVTEAFTTFAREHCTTLCDIYLDKLDDLALSLMESISHWQTQLATKKDASWKDREIWEDICRSDYRKLAGVDECSARHNAIFRSRAGYVILRDDRPLLKPTKWGHNAAGQLGQVFHPYYEEAHHMLTRTGSEGVITRVRLVDGKFWKSGPNPIPCEWSMKDAIHTFDSESEEGPPAPKVFG